MSKSIEEMYMELLIDSVDENIGDTTYGASGDDFEDFLSSKEIVETKEDLEERFGIVQPVEIEEEVHFKRFTKRREHKYTEKEMKEIRDGCFTTIVHDYGANEKYHQSDEERAANDMLDEISIKLQGLKRTYRKVDQYIEAMRVVVQAWEMLEEKGNYIHTREEFFKMVSEGKIVSNQIIMPKLKRMDQYNMDLIIKYISNPELDATDLVPAPVHDSWYDDLLDDEEIETPEDRMLRLLSPEELEFISNNEDNPPEIKVKDLERKLIKGYDRRDYGLSRRSNGKKSNKKERYIKNNLHDLLNRIQLNEKNREMGYTRSSLITHNIFDIDKKPKDFWDDLYFDGSWASDDDVFLYDIALREEMLRQHKSGSGYLTYGDEELVRFFKILEDNGINTIDLRRKMDCPNDGLSKAEEERKKKDNKKIESALIQRITKLNRSDKFKKIVTKAENALIKHLD